MKTIKNLLWIIIIASFFFSCTKEQSIVAVDGLKLSESAIEMHVGESRVLHVTITPADAGNKNVRWSSSNKTVASVEDGEITAHKTGETTISVTSEDGGYKASCMVTVVEVHPMMKIMGTPLPNEIRYISLSATAITPSTASWEVPIKSNVYDAEKGRGIITFQGNLTKLPKQAFYESEFLSAIALPDALSDMGNRSFESCSNLTYIRLPKNFKNIGEYTFYGCKSLEEIELPEACLEIQKRAFYDCSTLRVVRMSSNVQTIGDKAFAYCQSLKDISLSMNLTHLGAGAFYCSGLNNITFPRGVTKIYQGTFAYCDSLTSVHIPEGITEISVGIMEGERNDDTGAFDGCDNLREVSLPSTLKILGPYCFHSCNNLLNINIPSSVTKIGSCAFTNSGITELVIPSSVVEYEDPIFGCNLTNLTIPIQLLPMYVSSDTTIENLTIYGEGAIYDARQFQYCDIKHVKIQTGCTYIGARAFNGSKMSEITIPETVTVIDDAAFYNCKNLTNIYIHSEQPPVISTLGCNNVTIYVPTSAVDAYKEAWKETPNYWRISIEGYDFDKNTYATFK